MQEPSRTTLIISLLQDKAYLRLWFTGGMIGVIRWFEILAVSLYVLRESGSPLLVSLLIFARMAPPVVLGPWVGDAADRFDRVLMLRCGLGIQFMVSFVLMLLATADKLQLWHLAIGVAFGGALWSMEHTVRRPLIGACVGDENIGRAISLDSATFNATRMLGPLMGGALFNYLDLVGVFLCSTVMYGLSFFAMAVAKFDLRATSTNSETKLPLIERINFLTGIIRTDSRIAAVLAVTVLVNFFGFPYASMAPVVGERVLLLDPFAIGVLLAAEGVGAFVGAISLTLFSRPQFYLRTFGFGSLLFFVMVLIFANSQSYGFSVIALLLAGLGLAGFSAMQSAILLLATPTEARSRVMGALVVCIGSQPFGVLHIGFLADWLGVTTAMTVILLEGLVALFICVRLWPQLLLRGVLQA